MRGAVGKVLGHRLRRVGGRRGDQAAKGDEAGMTIKTMGMDRTQGLQATVVKATGRCSAGPPGAQRLLGDAQAQCLALHRAATARIRIGS